MGYDIRLLDPVSKDVIKLGEPHFMQGATYLVGGNRELSLSVTYNYAEIYYNFIDKEKGIRKIYGMTGLESISILEQAIDKLEDDVSDNYWHSTEGNAKRALIQLVTMAKMRPDGIWDGD